MRGPGAGFKSGKPALLPARNFPERWLIPTRLGPVPKKKRGVGLNGSDFCDSRAENFALLGNGTRFLILEAKKSLA